MHRVHPITKGNVFVPLRYLSEDGVRAITQDLTVAYFDTHTNTTKKIQLYKIAPGGLYLPRAYVHKTLPSVYEASYNDITLPIAGGNVWDGLTIAPRDAKQAEFMENVSQLVKLGMTGEIVDAQIEASTGVGKTAAMLKAACDNGITNVLIVVNRNSLKEGWLGSVRLKKGMRFFFGEEWVAKNVGIVQQNVCDYKKPVVVAMAPTLYHRSYPKEFYQKFGLVFIDEIHKFAAPTLHNVLSMFNAAVRVGATATVRKGKRGTVISTHLDEPKVVSKQSNLKPIVCVLRYEEEVRFYNYKGPEPALQNAKSCDSQKLLPVFIPTLACRNEFMANVIYQRGFLKNRQCLLLSDRVEHLIGMRQRLIDMGVPEETTGLYVGAYKTGKYKLTGKIFYYDRDKDVNYPVHFRGLPAFDTRADAEKYMRARRKELAKSVNKSIDYISCDFHIKPEVYKTNEADRNAIENSAQFIFATYGIFDTGIDVSRLDWGMELMPRGDVTQAIGRTLRVHEGKPVPVWYSVEDHFTQNVTLMGQQDIKYTYSTPLRLARNRNASYKQQNAEIRYIGNPLDALDKAKAR